MPGTAVAVGWGLGGCAPLVRPQSASRRRGPGTSFQTSSTYSPGLDIGADEVMVYATDAGGGMGSSIAAWRNAGYQVAVMTSTSHDWSGSFVNGRFGGHDHRGAVQQRRTAACSNSVPTVAYLGRSGAAGALLRRLVQRLGQKVGLRVQSQSVRVTQRGPYVSAIGFSGGQVPGTFADLQQGGFPVVRDPQVEAGRTALLRPLADLGQSHPQLVHTVPRVHQPREAPAETLLVGSGPTGVQGATRLIARHGHPVGASWAGQTLPWTWDAASGTCLIQHPTQPDPATLQLRWASGSGSA